MTPEDVAASDRERSAALDGWVAAFEREFAESGDFAASVSAMTEHGCFDVRAVVERWILAHPTDDAAPPRPQAPEEQPAPEPVLVELPAPAAADAPREPVVVVERRSSERREAGSTPDIAYFHSLLQGGIERAQIDEAFPDSRHVIDEAVAQHEAAAPILSDVPRGPSREDLNDEIRDLRQELRVSGIRDRRRWRSRG